ncbi:MAG: SMC-Scp complex subunit ScpB [Hyphomonadaceae bacterium]|nr:SMC-Scp complex subunit ScpB [Hyphomonadaceae bacterium]
MSEPPRSTKITPPRAPVADAFRRLEEAFAPAADTEPETAHEIVVEEAVVEAEPLPPPTPEVVRAAEALLFASGQALTAADIAEKLGEGVNVPAVLERLEREYHGRGVQLVQSDGAWRFQTAPDLAGLFAEKRETPKKLPRAALETLAVIAYHQPVTRAEIEDIRGVSLAKGSLDLLLEIGWVRPRGRRRSPGKPLTFGTTDAFLTHFNLPSLDSLPGKEDLKAMSLLDAQAAREIDIPRPGEGLSPDEEPLEGDPGFFVDHIDPEDGAG